MALEKAISMLDWVLNAILNTLGWILNHLGLIILIGIILLVLYVYLKNFNKIQTILAIKRQEVIQKYGKNEKTEDRELEKGN